EFIHQFGQGVQQAGEGGRAWLKTLCLSVRPQPFPLKQDEHAGIASPFLALLAPKIAHHAFFCKDALFFMRSLVPIWYVEYTYTGR
ncbi:MAG: hypothetical protein N2049_10105, partial [Anaerolineales bacterium]|nr:hypothetical protein [Anaerolineales bacterium]